MDLAGPGGAWQWGRVGGGGGHGSGWSQNGAAWESSYSHQEREPGRKVQGLRQQLTGVSKNNYAPYFAVLYIFVIIGKCPGAKLVVGAMNDSQKYVVGVSEVV